MTINVHISLVSVDDKIDHYIRQDYYDYRESGPAALKELYEFIIEGIANGQFDDPAEICAHVQERLREYMES